MNDFETLRDLYLTGKIWNIDDLVEANGIEGRIVRRGTNYVTFNDSNGKVHKAWLHEITLNELPDYSPAFIKKLLGKIDQVTHPRLYDKIVKDYVNAIKTRSYLDEPVTTKGKLIIDIIRQFTARSQPRVQSVVDYINKLVAKGVLPKELKAEFEIDERRTKQDPDIKDREGTQPAKYYAKDTEGDAMSVSTKKKRAAHFAKKKKGPAPGDATATTRPSKHTQKFKQMYGEKLGKDADMGDYIKDFEKSDSPQFKGKSKEKRKDMAIAAYLSRNETMIDEAIEGLKNKSKKSGISYSILKKVYDRGMAAYKTGHRPGTTAQQWAMARVNSFITKGSGTWGKADKDLADKVRGEAVSPEQQAAIAISKKKKASEKSVKEWFEANATRAKYQLQHGDDWWWKMNETHDAMLEKLGLCCDDCLDEANGPCWDGYKQVGMKNKGGKQVPNCVPEENNIDEADDKLLDVLKKKLSDEGGAAGFKDLEDAADKVGVDLTQDMLKKMSGIKQHRDGDYILEELDEGMKSTHVVVEPNGNVLGAASDEKGAKDMTVSNLRNVKGAKVIKLKRPISDKQVQRMLGRPFKESKLVKFNQFEELNAWGELPEEDKSGKKLNNPTRGDVKKYKVYVKNDKGNVVKVEFGDPNMSIKRDDPERRKSFRARHNCDNPGPKWKARYWSCKFWSTKSVTDLMKG